MIATVQRGSKVLSTSTLTDTDTIPSALADTALAVVIVSFRTSGGTIGRLKRRLWNAKITSTIQITFERIDNGDSNSFTTCDWEVWEFASGELQSLQKNATAENPTADPLNITVSSVTTSKAVVLFNLATAKDSTVGENRPTAYLSSAVNLEFDFYSAPASNDWKAFWTVIEFLSGDVTIQTGTISISGTTTSTTGSPGTNFVSTAATVLVLSFRGDASSDNFQRALMRLRATGVGTLTLDRTSGMIGSGSAEVARWHSIEFLDGTTAQYVDATIIDAGTSDAPSITTITTTRAGVLTSGWQNARRDHTSSQAEPQCFAGLVLSASSVSVVRGASGGTLEVPVFVIEFEATGGALVSLIYRSRARGPFFPVGV